MVNPHIDDEFLKKGNEATVKIMNYMGEEKWDKAIELTNEQILRIDTFIGLAMATGTQETIDYYEALLRDRKLLRMILQNYIRSDNNYKELMQKYDNLTKKIETTDTQLDDLEIEIDSKNELR